MKTINVEPDDHTYVYGEMVVQEKNGEIMEPYIYYGAPREGDPYSSITYYYPSENKYCIYDDDKLYRIVYTSTSWSDDREIYEIRDGKVIEVMMTEHGINRCYFYLSEEKIHKIHFTRRKFGIGNITIGQRVYVQDESIFYD
jgi:hypothetical protein